MKNLQRNAEMFRSIAGGATIVSVAEAHGKSVATVRHSISKICRKIGLPDVLDTIKSDPAAYLDRLDKLLQGEAPSLRSRLVFDLTRRLNLKDEAMVTPSYLANLSVGDLHRQDLTFVAITEIQEWLKSNGTALKRRPPDSEHEIREVRRAITLLDAYCFDTETLEIQFNHLTGADDDDSHLIPIEDADGA